MRILILGYDKLGEHLVASLAKEGHRITVMDASLASRDSLPQEPQVDAVLPSESLMEDLSGAGINNVDVFLALSQDDNRNIMAAQIASHIFHVADVICRVGDPERERFYKGLGLNVVCPTLVTVDTINNALKGTS